MDVARIELGAETYNFSSRVNGQPSAAVGIQLSSTGNAVATSSAVKAKLEELSKFFPKGVAYSTPYDTSPFVQASIEKVFHTLIEAVLLVFVVMLIFLQNFRYTLIPTIVVPVALLGTLSIMYATGFSINVLTMFAWFSPSASWSTTRSSWSKNVERIMAEEGLSPKEATRKAMSQITGAHSRHHVVLTCVFVPMAFFPGSTGIIYRQFSLTMVVSILFSAFLALSLTPALCATFLKPIAKGHHEKKGLAGWFNRGFGRLTKGYVSTTHGFTRRAGRMMVIYLALVVGLGYLYMQLPSGFVPAEDQGNLLVNIEGPPEASANRTKATVEQIEKLFKSEQAVRDVIAIQGFSFSGTGPNAALMFVTLKDWSERGANNSAQDIANRMNMKLFGLKDATSFALSPPPIPGFGATGGFSFRLQDRNGVGQATLSAAAAELMQKASAGKVVKNMRIEGLPDAAQVLLVIDREKANTFGISFADINNTITANLGSSYINDFPNSGRMQRVIVQARDNSRLQVEDLLKLNVRNASGGMVPLSSFAIAQWQKGSPQIVGYNGYRPSAFRANLHRRLSGAAIAEMEKLASTLPAGIGYEWTGQTLEEIKSGSQAPFLFASASSSSSASGRALRKLVDPALGDARRAARPHRLGTRRHRFHMPNDIYFKVGLIAIIGLSAKNAILIIEFARDHYAEGMSLLDSAIEAARLRFRPIVMTSLAFTLGVVPLAIATGASAASQNAIGITVLGGMISATLLAVVFVPAFFVFVLRLFRTKRPDLDTVTLHHSAPRQTKPTRRNQKPTGAPKAGRPRPTLFLCRGWGTLFLLPHGTDATTSG